MTFRLGSSPPGSFDWPAGASFIKRTSSVWIPQSENCFLTPSQWNLFSDSKSDKSFDVSLRESTSFLGALIASPTLDRLLAAKASQQRKSTWRSMSAKTRKSTPQNLWDLQSIFAKYFFNQSINSGKPNSFPFYLMDEKLEGNHQDQTSKSLDSILIVFSGLFHANGRSLESSHFVWNCTIWTILQVVATRPLKIGHHLLSLCSLIFLLLISRLRPLPPSQPKTRTALEGWQHLVIVEWIHQEP